MGMHFGWPSSSIPILMNENFIHQFTMIETSVLVSLIPLGAIPGSLLGEIISDLTGRRNLIVISTIPLVVSWLLLAFGTLKYFYFVARFLAGIADGLLYTIIPAYTAEISDPEIRGMLGSLLQMFMNFGMLFINVLYFILNDSLTTVAYVGAGLSITTLFIVPLMPESPYVHIQNRNMTAAEDCLKRLKGKSDISIEMKRICEGMFIEKKDNDKESCVILSRYKKCLLISVGMTFVQHFSGMIAIQSYCEILFSFQTFISPKLANILYFVTFFLSNFALLFWVDYCGRKPLLLFSISICCLALSIHALYLLLKDRLDLNQSSLDSVELFAVLIFTSAYSAGLQTLPILITSEIFPTNLKSTAQCIGNIGYSVYSTMVVIMFSFFSENDALYVPFFIFALVCLLGVIFVVKFVPETKHKTLEEIQLSLKQL